MYTHHVYVVGSVHCPANKHWLSVIVHAGFGQNSKPLNAGKGKLFL